MITDVILGGSLGDEGKGKVCAHLSASGRYSHVLRFNGGGNAGHSIYVKGQKVVTHMIPTGAVHGIRSIIGPGCVLNEVSFFKELEELSRINPNIKKCIGIAKNAHIVQEKHKEEELLENKIGTTKQGIGPAYRDKYARIGVRAEKVSSLKEFMVDMYEEFYESNLDAVILCEGAQAFGLDIDWGEYPFVTSSHCGVGAVINNGIPHSSIRDVIAVVKAYDTYVGTKSFQNNGDAMLNKLGDLGMEYGATTGRRRQCNYLNIDMVKKMCDMNGVTQLIVNKVDILQQADCWKIMVGPEKIEHGDNVVNFYTEQGFCEFIRASLPKIKSIVFSYSAETI